MRTLFIALFVLLVGCGGRAEATDSELVAGGADEPVAPPESAGSGNQTEGGAGGATGSGRAGTAVAAAAGAQEPPGGAEGLAGAVDLPGGAAGASATLVGSHGGAGGAGAGGLAIAPATGGFTATGGEQATGGIQATGGVGQAAGGRQPTGGASSATGGTVATGGAPSTCDGVLCTGGQRCEAGVCVCPYYASTLCLIGPEWQCTNLHDDAQHCGECGNECNEGSDCELGTCGATGGAGGQGGAGTECVCDSGPCCDGCNHLGPDTLCFDATWQTCHTNGYLTRWYDLHASTWCSGVSSYCGVSFDFIEETIHICPDGTHCVQIGDTSDVNAEYHGDMPSIVCE